MSDPVTGFDDGQTSPDEIFGRLYPSTTVYGVGGPDEVVLMGNDVDPDDMGGMPIPQAADDPHHDLANVSGDDEDPDDL